MQSARSFSFNRPLIALMLGAVMLCPPSKSSASSDPNATRDTLVLYASTPSDILSATHGGQLQESFLRPDGMRMMTEKGLRTGIIMTFRLRDRTTGEAIAFGNQMSITPLTQDGKIEKMEWPSEWTVTIPGRGTLFMSQIEKPGNIFGAFDASVRSGGVWKGNIVQRTTQGPRSDGLGSVVGGTGEFAGTNGTFIEINRFTEYDTASNDGLVGEIELQIHLE